MAPARADILPPDQDCPSGEVWVRGHSGGCRKVAPTDCAPGRRGVIGGQCIVAAAGSGACESGDAREVDLCLESRLDRGNGRVAYEPPRAYEVPVGILGPGLACESAAPAPVALPTGGLALGLAALVLAGRRWTRGAARAR